MRQSVMADYLRDPKAVMFNQMIKQGTSTQPVRTWQEGLGNLSQALIGSYMASKLRGEYEGKEEQAKAEREAAKQFLFGGQKPDYAAASKILSSPYNEDFQNTLFNAQMQQGQTEAQQEFLRQQQQASFQNAAEQQARSFANARELSNLERAAALQAKKDIIDYESANNPQKMFLRNILQNNTQGTQNTSVPQYSTLDQDGSTGQQQVDQQALLFNAAMESSGIKAPQGYIFAPKQGGGAELVPYLDPKEKALIEKTQKENEQAAIAKKETDAALLETVKAGKALVSDPNRKAGTGFSSVFSSFPASSARDFKANLDAFKAKNFLPAVQKLRGMGALSENEGKKLVDSIGALDAGMSEEAFLKSLNEINSNLEAAAQRAGLNVANEKAGWSIQRID